MPTYEYTNNFHPSFEESEVFILVDGKRIAKIMNDELTRRQELYKREQNDVRVNYSVNMWQRDIGIDDTTLNRMLLGKPVMLNHKNTLNLINYFAANVGPRKVYEVLIAMDMWKEEWGVALLAGVEE